MTTPDLLAAARAYRDADLACDAESPSYIAALSDLRAAAKSLPATPHVLVSVGELEAAIDALGSRWMDGNADCLRSYLPTKGTADEA